MNKKTLIQYTLFFFIIVILFTFLNIFIFKDKKINEVNNVKKEKQSDTIKDLQYLSKDTSGNTYLVRAKNGVVNMENSDVINLFDVNAKITFDKNKIVTITANKASYNNNNNDTEFSENVYLIYNNHHLKSKNLLIKFSENYAKIYNDVIYTDFFTKLFADKIEVDLINRTSKISMFEEKQKVKVTYNNNGFN
tara:strand:- start:840 stop:1418 length:579 start_codon:yes stop_codon:yes gene_type:complete